MHATVHSYLNLKKAELHLTLGKIESTIALQHPDMSMSDTKLSKIFKDPKTKISMEDLFVIVEAMGLDKREILAILGEQEYRASASVGYMGATELIAEFERREAEQRDHYEKLLEKEAAIRKNIHVAFTDAKGAFDHAVDVIQQNHQASLQERDSLYALNVSHLKTQITTDAQEYHDAIAAKDKSLSTMAEHAGAAMKSMKWWRATAVTLIVTLSVVIIYLAWELRNLDKGATAILIDMVRQGLL